MVSMSDWASSRIVMSLSARAIRSEAVFFFFSSEAASRSTYLQHNKVDVKNTDVSTV